MSSGKKHAFDASAKVATKRQPKVTAIPDTEGPERGAAVARAFTEQVKELAEIAARNSPDFNPDHAERRAQSRWAANQLPEDRIAAIEADYRECVLTVSALCLKHHIHASTLYKLASQRGWPARTAIKTQMQAAVQEANVASIVAEQLTARALAMPIEPGEAGQHAALMPESSRAATTEQLMDAARQDRMIESYSMAAAQVLAKHRSIAGAAVDVSESLLTIYKGAVEAIERQHPDNPLAVARALAPLLKEFGSTLRNVQQAIDMQRQAFALDDQAGKGLPLHLLNQHRAVQAGMAQPSALPAPQGKAGDDEPAPQAYAPSPLTGGYEDLVREAERRGVPLQ